MKTKRYYTVTMIILALVFATSLKADVSSSGIAPVNLPATETDLINAAGNLPEFSLDEEAYIDDIPFDTKCISNDCIYNKAVAVTFYSEEEEYINDIPFETETIKNNISLFKDYYMDDEAYINDIPFNTNDLAKNNSNKMAFKN